MSRKIDLGVYELAYSLNFKSNFQDVYLFSFASWNLAANLLSFMSNGEKLIYKQKVCVFLIGKSLRLLRAIEKLAVIGYWPEAEILLRALLETKSLLVYILRDKTEKRAKEWLSRKNPKEKWPVAELMKDYKD